MSGFETLIQMPKRHWLCKGVCESETPLNATDGAFLAAGVGNTNLLQMSSIMPPHCEWTPPEKLPLGALVPIAYAVGISEIPGETIAAAVAVAYPEDPELSGLIMEAHGTGTAAELEAKARSMAETGLKMRDFKIREIRSTSAEITIERCGAAFAGVVLWI